MALSGGKRAKNRINVDFIVFAVLMLISITTLFFSTRNFFDGFKNVGLSVFSSLRGGIHTASSFVTGTILSIRELAKLKSEHNELLERISRYEQLERNSAELRQENNRLREQLGFVQNLRYRHIPAELIGRDPDNLFSAFVINKGTKSGVTVNMPVIAYQDGIQGLAGKVIEAGLFESLVMPLYDHNSFVPSRLSECRYEGISEGQGSQYSPLKMRFIQKRARDEISIGEMVVSSGLGRIFPSGINLGRVNRIYFDENEISMEVELDIVINYSRLEYVFVIGALIEDTDEDTDQRW
jgi:rod shape-determining protein MreC